MKKSSSVSVRLVSAVSSLALALGCGSPKPPQAAESSQPTHQKECGDEAGRTVDWTKCEEESKKSDEARRSGIGYLPLYFWYYGPFSGRTMAPGTPLTGYSRVPPTGNGVRIANPTVRGGFGSSARPSGAGA